MIGRSRNRVVAGLGWALGLLFFAASSAGQPAPAGTRVTSPAELAAMGFGPGAIVYLAPGADRPQRPTAGPQPDAPDQFGTDVPSFTAYNGDQFHSRVSTRAYSCSFCSGDVLLDAGNAYATVQVEMPSGSWFQGVRWWGVDNHTEEDLHFFVSKTCLPPFGAASPVSTILASGESTGDPFNVSGFISIPGTETVDNESCTYIVLVRFDATGGIVLYKVRAQWARQVSTAPALASFEDVPTDHVFFQFVEALSASGITAGCSETPALYCPDAPLTRGQMAVFLAKALGLQWP